MEIYFNTNIKHLRKSKGLKLEDMGPLMGIGRSTLSNYENGRFEPDLHKLVSLADFYGVTVDELLKKDLSGVSSNKAGIDTSMSMTQIVSEFNQMKMMMGKMEAVIKPYEKLHDSNTGTPPKTPPKTPPISKNKD